MNFRYQDHFCLLCLTGLYVFDPRWYKRTSSNPRKYVGMAKMKLVPSRQCRPGTVDRQIEFNGQRMYRG